MSAVGGASSVTVKANAPTVALPTTESEEMVAIRRVELRSIKEQIQRMGNFVDSAAAWAYTWLGAAISVAISLIALYGAVHAGGVVAGWVLLAHWFALFSFAFMAWFAWRFDRESRDKQQTDRDVVVWEITAIEQRYPIESEDLASGPAK